MTGSGVATDSARARPRILIDALSYHPEAGGLAQSLRHILTTCAQITEFEFVVAHHRAYTADFARYGLPVYPVRFPLRLRFAISLLLLPWIVRRTRADAVYCDISALPVGLGVPGLVTVHDLHFMWDPLASGRRPRRRVFVWLYWQQAFVRSLRRASVIRAISQTTSDDIARLVGTRAPVRVVHQYVVAPDPTSPPRAWPAGGEPVRLLFLGSVATRRNLPFLLEALREFRGAWHLDVVGAMLWGMEEVGEMATDERVTFHGFVTEAERDAFLRHSHILICPSVYEGFSYPVCEAMCHRMLVLTSDIPVFREYVPDECRFALDTPERLSGLYNSLDAARYAELVGLCGPRAARFSRAAHVEGHRGLFTELLSGEVEDGASPGPAGGRGLAAAFRAAVRQGLSGLLGPGAEVRAHRLYHRARRLAGRFDPPESASTLRLLAYFACGARTVVDVGANYGLYSHFLFRHASPGAVLYTFEPNVQASALLRSNVPGSARVRHFDVALGASEGAATLHVPLDATGNPVTALGWVAPGGGENMPDAADSTVLVRTFDSLVADGVINLRAPVFMKVDVEGFELSVLRGASRLLREVRPLIYFECEQRHLDRQGVAGGAVWDILATAGYAIVGCQAGRYVACSGPLDGAVNYFAIPGAGPLPHGRNLDPAELIALATAWRG